MKETKKKPRTRGPTDEEIRMALSKIAQMGQGIPSNMVDWDRIGRNAVYLARETFCQRCVECER